MWVCVMFLFLCSGFVELLVFEFVEMAFLYHVMGEVHGDVKVWGGGINFGRAKRRLYMCTLVCLVFVFLYILWLWFLCCGAKGSLFTMLGVVKWVRG